MERMTIESKAGMKLLQQGVLGLRLKYDGDNSPVLVLCSENGELPLKMASIYQQVFRARLDGKA